MLSTILYPSKLFRVEFSKTVAYGELFSSNSSKASSLDYDVYNKRVL